MPSINLQQKEMLCHQNKNSRLSLFEKQFTITSRKSKILNTLSKQQSSLRPILRLSGYCFQCLRYPFQGVVGGFKSLYNIYIVHHKSPLVDDSSLSTIARGGSPVESSLSPYSPYLFGYSMHPLRVSCLDCGGVEVVSDCQIVGAPVACNDNVPCSFWERVDVVHGFFSLVKRLADFFYFVAHKIAQNRTNGRKARGAGW